MLIKLAGEGGVADNSVEERAGGARETDKIAGEGEAIRDKIAGEGEAVHDNTAGERVDEEADEIIEIEETSVELVVLKAAGGEEGPLGAAEVVVCSR